MSTKEPTPLKPVMRLNPSMPVEHEGKPCVWCHAQPLGAYRRMVNPPSDTTRPIITHYSCHPDAWAAMPAAMQAEYRIEGTLK